MSAPQQLVPTPAIIEEAVAKLKLGPDDILLVDPSVIDLEGLLKTGFPSGSHRSNVVFAVVRRPGESFEQAITHWSKETAKQALEKLLQ